MSQRIVEQHISVESAPGIGDLVDRIAALFKVNYEIESVEVTVDDQGLPIVRVVLVR